MRKLGYLLCVAALTACASNRSAERDRTVTVTTDESAERQESLSEELERFAAQADGTQPGRVTDMSDGMLVLDPYQVAAGDAMLQIAEDVPVFQGDGKVTTRALQPGVDVRVYYRHAGEGERPEVLAVEVLDEHEAREIEDSIKYAPRSNE